MIVVGACSIASAKLLARGIFSADTEIQECLPGGKTVWWVRGPAGTRFSCKLTRVPNSGGHHHAKGPAGTITPISGVIPTGGVFKSVVHQAPEVSGDIAVHWAVGGVQGTNYTRVRFPGLRELPIVPEIERVGVKSVHPQSHFGHPALISALLVLARRYHREFAKPLEVNDISLPWGGLFDHKATWAKPHETHRTGRDVDIRTRSMNPDQKRFLVANARLLDFSVHPETTPPHHHLTFRATASLLKRYQKRR
jgi:hypothetical protein